MSHLEEQSSTKIFDNKNGTDGNLLQEGDQVNVKWGRKWYPATLLILHDGEGYVEFDDPDYEELYVEVKDIRAISVDEKTKEYQSVKTTPGQVAGSFPKDDFKKYVQDVLVKEEKLLEFTPAELQVIKQSLTLTVHAAERANDRYDAYLQEFWRSVQNVHDALYSVQQRYVIIFTLDSEEEVAMTFDGSFSKILSLERNFKPCKKRYMKKCEMQMVQGLPLEDTATVVSGLWQNFTNQGGHNIGLCDIFLSIEMILEGLQYRSYQVTTRLVFSTTSTLVVSNDLLKIMTCYQNHISFGAWKKAKLSNCVVKDKPSLSRKFVENGRIEKINMERKAKGKCPVRANNSAEMNKEKHSSNQRAWKGNTTQKYKNNEQKQQKSRSS